MNVGTYRPNSNCHDIGLCTCPDVSIILLFGCVCWCIFVINISTSHGNACSFYIHRTSLINRADMRVTSTKPIGMLHLSIYASDEIKWDRWYFLFCFFSLLPFLQFLSVFRHQNGILFEHRQFANRSYAHTQKKNFAFSVSLLLLLCFHIYITCLSLHNSDRESCKIVLSKCGHLQFLGIVGVWLWLLARARLAVAAYFEFQFTMSHEFLLFVVFLLLFFLQNRTQLIYKRAQNRFYLH